MLQVAVVNENKGSAFPNPTAWAKEAVPGTEGIWAPDIAFVDGEYRLYYSISTFGSASRSSLPASRPSAATKAKHCSILSQVKKSQCNGYCH